LLPRLCICPTRNLNQRGYPIADSGFYTNEPIYAEMVRTALRLGYTVVAYDAENAGVGDPRESAGAENLYNQVFKKIRRRGSSSTLASRMYRSRQVSRRQQHGRVFPQGRRHRPADDRTDR
jgi:hypothetical protein